MHRRCQSLTRSACCSCCQQVERYPQHRLLKRWKGRSASMLMSLLGQTMHAQAARPAMHL